MSRLSFRPRPLDIHKKLPIVKSVKDFEDEETITSACNFQTPHLAAEVENEQIPSKKIIPEIPIPRFAVVDTYERDYLRTFTQPTSYLRGRGARAEIGDFVEYDLDNEDEVWLQELNSERRILMPEKFEALLFKLEVLDHKSRERAGLVAPTFGSPTPILQLDAAIEALQPQSTKFAVFQSVYKYWKEKREQWQKPFLRHLQPPPSVNDTNPFNVFRPREKAHRFHTRRIQRRENNIQSFEKLRVVRRNLDQAKPLLEALIKRAEKKREVFENEIRLQQIQIKYKNDIRLIDDGLALPDFSPLLGDFCSSEDDFAESGDMGSIRTVTQPDDTAQNPPPMGSDLLMIPTESMKQQSMKRYGPYDWLNKRDPLEPLLLFTRSLHPENLVAAGIIPPLSPPIEDHMSVRPFRFRGRFGRGGRIVFDRWNPLLQTQIGFD